MPAKKRTHEAMPSKELTLATIERAELHRHKHNDPVLYRGKPDRPGVLMATIKEHLGLSPGGASTIRLRPTWNQLKDAGLIEQVRRYGLDVWILTPDGQQHLDHARQAGEIGSLPESPQHRQWREARGIAAERIGTFREMMQAALGEAAGMLDAHEASDSSAWHALSQRLQRACDRLESASYCLHEWPEPDDTGPDYAPHGKGGCRSIRRFDKD